MTSPRTTQKVRALITEALEACGRDPVEGIADDDFLPDLLDSVVLSSLLAMIEDDWHIQIEDEEITPERFETITGLATFIEGKGGRTDA